MERQLKPRKLEGAGEIPLKISIFSLLTDEFVNQIFIPCLVLNAQEHDGHSHW